MFERIESDDGFVAYRSSLMRERGVPHLFTTRVGPGGVELDLAGLGVGEHACEQRLAQEAGLVPGARLLSAQQVHGADVVDVTSAPMERAREADALISATPQRGVLVFSADCVPVLIARVDGTRVAAVHAGWRGLVAGVIARAVDELRGAPLVAAIGPCLSTTRFEVGPEVADAFRAIELADVVHESPRQRPHVDLRGAAKMQLARAGVLEIDVDARCTWDDAELFSYRRDVTHGGRASTGRLAAIVAPR